MIAPGLTNSPDALRATPKSTPKTPIIFSTSDQNTTKNSQDLRLATTTSICDTGLLDVLNRKFELENNAKISTICEGTGKAIATGEMGDTIITADIKNSYTLSDRQTYLAMKDKIKLRIIFESDQKYFFNPYHVMAVNPSKFPNVKYDIAMKYISYVTSSQEQNIIRNYGKDKYGEALFVPEEDAGGVQHNLLKLSIITSTPTPTPTPAPTINMEFVQIPAGEFDMGSPAYTSSYDSEGPVHHVKIASSFYMGKYEVTQKQWREVMGTSPSYFTGDDLPVEQVSWNDVQQFIQKLNEKEGANKYRLPSEAEWEYAAHAGATTKYFFGDDESKLGEYAWYSFNSGRKTHDVGQKKPNPWGLNDMYGNIWEWVQDNWHADYNGAPTDGSSWESVGGSFRVGRGCSWGTDAWGCRSAFRYDNDPDYRGFSLGFRLLRIS
jgi:formylglycine-generating enzyme required for sulfatase activity